MKYLNPKHLNLENMWKVYRLSKGSFATENLEDLSLPVFFGDMINNLPQGAYLRIVGLFVNKKIEEVIKIDSLEMASIFVGGMIKNELISFHRFVEDLNGR
jgi:hypothetical protein